MSLVFRSHNQPQRAVKHHNHTHTRGFSVAATGLSRDLVLNGHARSAITTQKEWWYFTYPIYQPQLIVEKLHKSHLDGTIQHPRTLHNDLITQSRGSSLWNLRFSLRRDETFSPNELLKTSSATEDYFLWNNETRTKEEEQQQKRQMNICRQVVSWIGSRCYRLLCFTVEIRRPLFYNTHVCFERNVLFIQAGRLGQ